MVKNHSVRKEIFQIIEQFFACLCLRRILSISQIFLAEMTMGDVAKEYSNLVAIVIKQQVSFSIRHGQGGNQSALICKCKGQLRK